MSSADGPASHQVVTALRRPPVRQSTLVRASARHTFDTFVTTIGAWWPVQPFSHEAVLSSRARPGCRPGR